MVVGWMQVVGCCCVGYRGAGFGLRAFVRLGIAGRVVIDVAVEHMGLLRGHA